MIDRARILPIRRQGAVLSVLGPALAALHALLFRLLGPRTAGVGAAAWPATAAAVAGIILFRDFATSRREDRLPDLLSALAWGSAAAVEANLMSGALAATRLVPAVLFPLFGFLLPLGQAAAYAVAAACLMLLDAPAGRAVFAWDAGILGMAVLGLGAGQAARRRQPGRGGADAHRPAAGASRSIVSPWDAPPAAPEEGSPSPPGLVGWRRELEEGIRRALEGILPATGADAVYFLTPPPAPGRPFESRAVSRTGTEDGLAALEIPDSFAPAREAILFRRAVCADASEAAAWSIGSGGRALRFSGVAAAPVIAGGQVEGAILALRVDDDGWAGPVVQVLETGAFFVAREHDRARASYRQARYLARQSGLHAIVRRIAEVAERGTEGEARGAAARQAVYGAAAGQIRELFRLDRVLVIEALEPGNGGTGVVAWEEAPGGAGGGDGTPAKLAGSYVAWVLEKGTHRIFSGAAERTERHPVLPAAWSREGERGYMLVPLSGGGGFRAVLACVTREKRTFDGRDAEAVREIASVMMMGISHALRTESLSRAAERDGLTGLLNQKTFRSTLRSVVGRLDERYPCAVVMLDIDHFKRVNDTHGHPAGDEVLRNVSSIIAKTIRKVDIAGRYGGEEFAIYLHQADREKAEQGAERLRLMIEKSRIGAGGREIRVTASLGVACYPACGRSSDELLSRADEALYRSKQGGRNRVTLA